MRQCLFRLLLFTLILDVSACANTHRSTLDNPSQSSTSLSQSKSSHHRMHKSKALPTYQSGNALSNDDAPIQNLMA